MQKHFILLLIFAALNHFVSGQNNRYIKGQVKLLNRSLFVEGINVKVTYNSIDYTDITKTDGVFLIELPQNAPFVKELAILNKQYEVVEKDYVKDLNTIDNPSKKPDIILVCKIGELERLSDKYFDAMFLKERQKYDKKIKLLRGRSNQIKVEKDAITNELENLKLILRQQADLYSKFDLSDPEYKEAYAYFLTGAYEHCLRVLPSDQTLTESANTLQSAKRKIIRADLLKANSYAGLKEFNNADRYFLEAIQTDPLNLDSYISYSSSLGRRGDLICSSQIRIKGFNLAEMFFKDEYLFIYSNAYILANQFLKYFSKFDSTIFYANKGLKNLKAIPDTAYISAGNIRFQEAQLYDLKAMAYDSLKVKDSAVNYFHLAINRMEQLTPTRFLSTEYFAEVCDNLGRFYIRNKMNDSALAYYQKGYNYVILHISLYPDDQIQLVYDRFNDLLDLITDMNQPDIMKSFISSQTAFFEPLVKLDDKKYSYFMAAIYDELFSDTEDDSLLFNYATLYQKYSEIIFNNSNYFLIEDIDYFKEILQDVYSFLMNYYVEKDEPKMSELYRTKFIAITNEVLSQSKFELLDTNSISRKTHVWTAKRLLSDFEDLEQMYFKDKTLDSIIIYYNVLIEIFNNKMVSINDSTRKSLLSITHSKLGFYYLFDGEYEKSLQSVDACLEYEPLCKLALATKAPALLLSNRYDEAFAIYAKYKNEKYPSSQLLWKERFLNDLNRLENYGIHHPDFKRIKVFLNKK